MKTIITTLTAVALTALLLTTCKKDNTSYDSYFYTSKDTNETRLSLFIDNSYKGDLPYLKNKPTCDSTALKGQCLYLTLTAGKHTLTAKDKQGNVKSETIFKLKTNLFGTEKMSGKSQTGGDEISKKDECLIVNLFY